MNSLYLIERGGIAYKVRTLPHVRMVEITGGEHEGDAELLRAVDDFISGLANAEFSLTLLGMEFDTKDDDQGMRPAVRVWFDVVAVAGSSVYDAYMADVWNGLVGEA